MNPLQPIDQYKVDSFIKNGDFDGAMAILNPNARPSQQTLTSPIVQQQQSSQPSLEQRVTQLEQLIQQVASPVIDEAAQVGTAILGALGQAMTPEQAKWVQSRLNSSPEFFASQGCKDAIDIFISEWQNYETGRPK